MRTLTSRLTPIPTSTRTATPNLGSRSEQQAFGSAAKVGGSRGFDLHEAAALASSQYGVVTQEELCDLGLPEYSQRRWRDRGFLHPVQSGVFALGTPELSVRGHWLAAIRSFHGLALLSHRSALELWGYGDPRLPIELTVPHGQRQPRSRCLVHESRHLPETDCCIREKIPVTSIARSLLDVAAHRSRQHREFGLDRLEDIAVLALRRGQTTINDLARQAINSRYRPGARRFKLLVQRLDPDIIATRSHAERLLRKLISEWKLPPGKPNSVVCGFEVDLLWEEERQIVELDGRAYHSDAERFERDRRRDAALARNGYAVLRISYRMLVDSPREVADTIRATLATRRRQQAQPSTWQRI